MRIAIVAPLYLPIKLDGGYGGVELVVYNLAYNLARSGHQVTLFAAAGSDVPNVTVVPMTSKPLMHAHGNESGVAHVAMLAEIRSLVHRGGFDVVHFHVDSVHLPIFGDTPQAERMVTTVHNLASGNGRETLYRAFPRMALVSISDAQRATMPTANWVSTVHHGIRTDELVPLKEPSRDYLAFLGRVSPEKGVLEAIEVANRTGVPLKIAAGITSDSDHEYYKSVLEPAIRDGNAEFIGEVSGKAKHELLANARAFLFPIKWAEPFGLVQIEAMACGVPVLAFAPENSSVNEVVDDGVTGYICADTDEMSDRVHELKSQWTLPMIAIRARFEKRFSAERMAADYVDIYERAAEPLVPIMARPKLRAVASR